MKHLGNLVSEIALAIRDSAKSQPTSEGNAEGMEDRPSDGSMAALPWRVIFLKRDILDPMQAVLNVPVLSDVLEKLARTQATTAEIAVHLVKRLLSSPTLALHPDQA